jgi:hypothetical protein
MSAPDVVRVDSAPPAGWEEFAREHGTFYHLPAWIDGVARLFRYRVRYLSVASAEGLTGILPVAVVPTLTGARRLVSFPFSFVAGPVAVDEAANAMLLERAIAEARSLRCRRVEIKQSKTTPAPVAGFHRTTHYIGFRVATSGGLDPVTRQLHIGSTRRGIRKAEREGVEVVRGESIEDWTRMAELQEATSLQHGTPPPPRRFFTDLGRTLQAAGLAELSLAIAPKTRDVVAGIVVWKGPREWVYSFGASRPESLPLRPNHLLLWRLYQAAAAAGVDVNLGRAAPEQVGLVEFKVRWAGQPVPLQYDYWPTPGGLNVQSRDRGALAIGARLWKRLPAGLARWGSRLYRYLG